MKGMICEVRCTARLFLEFESEDEAERVARALEPDNLGFIETRRSGSRLEAAAQAATIPALLHTLDDYLACLAVAENLTRGQEPR